jgi:hypothetical protein
VFQREEVPKKKDKKNLCRENKRKEKVMMM